MTKPTIQISPLGSTGISVSNVCLGTMTFGGQTAEPEADRIVSLCLERGVNFFDTANVYHAGRSEELLGRLLGERRHSVVLASKVGGLMGAVNDGTPRLLAHQIRSELEASLRRLGTDYLDIYYLHQPDPNSPIEDTLDTLLDLRRQGKIRAIGVSNYASWQVCELLALAARSHSPVAIIGQVMWNVLARGVEREFVPMARRCDVPIVAYNPLAGGLLTGKHTSSAPVVGSRFDGNRQYQDRYWNSANFAAIARLGALAADSGRSLASLALNWLLHHTSCSGILLGASTFQQLHANLNALDEGPLDELMLRVVDQEWIHLKGVAPEYFR
jgi:aryl-alcohol dehydrogenase-like predicted oxidoreductase